MTGTANPQPRVAIVTGGSRGIGRQSAERLGVDGFAVTYASNATEADFAVQADVADEGAVSALFDTTEQAFGGIDVVVHAAGSMALSSIVDQNLDALDRMHRTNIRGTFVVDQQAARRVRSGGAIINFSTSVIGLALSGYAAYVASKGAVEAITMVLARELRGRGITVNAVAPGPTATALFLDGKDEDAIARMAAQPPMQRLGLPGDIAEMVAFLGGSSRWINGQVIRANGGIV